MHSTILCHITAGLKSERERGGRGGYITMASDSHELPNSPLLPALSSAKSEGKLDLSEKRSYREKILQQCNPFTEGSSSYAGRSLEFAMHLGNNLEQP